MDPVHIHGKQFGIFIPEAQIEVRVREIAADMNRQLSGTEPVFLAVLNGAFFFAADLLKHLNFNYEISFVKVSSYKGMESGEDHKILLGLDENLAGRNIVILEDIIDSGKTMFNLIHQLNEIHVSDIKIATLILKRDALKYPVEPDYLGFEAPVEFLIGYGLDFDKKGRHYRDIYKIVTH